MVRSRAGRRGPRRGGAFCTAVDVGRTAVGIGRKGLGYLPPLPAFITRRVPTPVLKLWTGPPAARSPRRRPRPRRRRGRSRKRSRPAPARAEACRKTSRKEAPADLKPAGSSAEFFATQRVLRPGKRTSAASVAARVAGGSLRTRQHGGSLRLSCAFGVDRKHTIVVRPHRAPPSNPASAAACLRSRTS